jgi:hypothetical protein
MKNLYDLLVQKYPIKEYALMAEVSDAAGFSRSRSADYMVMSLWPSRGCSLSGIEVKSYRSDWLSERKRPEKAENIFQYCDYFWLLTADEKVATLEEIPETWGWMTVRGSKIFVVKEAPRQQPKPITRSFLAALLKRAGDKSNFVHINSINDRIEAARQDGENTAKTKLKEYNELFTTVREFEAATGVKLSYYLRWRTTPGELGKVVKHIEDGGAKEVAKKLERIQQSIADLMQNLTSTIEAVQKVNEFIDTKPSAEPALPLGG